MLEDICDPERALAYLKIAEDDIQKHGDSREQSEFAELSKRVQSAET